MNKRGVLVTFAGAIILASTILVFGQKTVTPPPDETLWPTKGWATASPATVGLDEQVLRKLDKEHGVGDVFADGGRLCGLPLWQEGL